MDPYILTTRDEYKSNLYIAILLWIIIIPCGIICYNKDVQRLIWLGLLIFSFAALWCIYDYIKHLDKRKSEVILMISENGIDIKEGSRIKKIYWTDITTITFYMGTLRMEGLMMSISVLGKRSVSFSFFKYSPSFCNLRKLVKTIRYYSGNPNIIKFKSGLHRIMEPGDSRDGSLIHFGGWGGSTVRNYKH